MGQAVSAIYFRDSERRAPRRRQSAVGDQYTRNACRAGHAPDKSSIPGVGGYRSLNNNDNRI